VTNGLNVVVDGSCKIAFGVEVVAILTEDVDKAIRVIVLGFGDSEKETRVITYLAIKPELKVTH
jgi:hypothetical protein